MLGFPSRIALGCSIFKPSRSQRVCCGVSSNASVSLRGHWNLPLSSRLYKSRNPSPSQRSPLIRSQRLPQNKNNAVLYRSSCSCALTIIASPSIERLKSVYPVTMYTCLSNARSFSIIHVLGRVDTKPNNASFRQNFTHPALKSLDRRQPACDFLPCLRKIYARKSAYYLSVNTP